MTPFNGYLCAAPMAGITDKPFRKMMRRFGQHPLYTEMIGAETFVRSHPVTLKMMQVQDESNLIVQIVGIHIDSLIKTALAAQEKGAVGIDVNMGCPVKKLIANGSGAALMKTPDKAAEIVSALKKELDIPVSVKIRSGWDLQHVNAPEFARVLSDAGADSITVHGRTKEQGYAGLCDTNVIADVKKAVKIPVIANGDVRDGATAHRLKEKTNSDGVMVARGCLGKPWILNEIQTGQKPDFDLTELVLDHFDELLSYYGTAGLFVARKHLAWYAADKDGVADFCRSVFQSEDIKTIKGLIYDFFKKGGVKK